MANSLMLCRPVLPTLGAGGGCSEGASGKNRVSLSSLHAPILFSGFPVYEEIVASRVTLPSKGEGKCVCVFECKGIQFPSTHLRFSRQAHDKITKKKQTENQTTKMK